MDAEDLADRQGKELATAQAVAAMAGLQLLPLADSGFLLTRHDYSRRVEDLHQARQAIEAFRERVH